jgi:hypothetical protein
MLYKQGLSFLSGVGIINGTSVRPEEFNFSNVLIITQENALKSKKA